MNKVLFFARHLIPYSNSVGTSLRIVTMAKYFSENGFDVTLLAAKGESVSYFGLEDEVTKLNPIYLEDYLQRIYTAKANASITNECNPTDSKFVKQIKFYLKNFLKNAVIVDPAILFVPKFIFKAFELIKNEDINVLVVSSPPHSSQVLGLVVKIVLRRRIFLVVDYRDGWNTFHLFKSNWRWKFFLDSAIEKMILRRADLFVYQSPVVIRQIVANLLPDFSGLERKSILVRNGYTTLSVAYPASGSGLIQSSANGPFLLGYFGGLNFEEGSYRNPTRLLRLIDSVAIKCEVIVCGSESGILALGPFQHLSIRYLGQVPLNVAKQLMRCCDSLLVFHASASGAEEVIPGKFYEYVDAARPILVYGPENMECGRMVEEFDIGSFLSMERADSELINEFERFISAERQETYVRNVVKNRENFSREFQYAGLVRRIKRELIFKRENGKTH